MRYVEINPAFTRQTGLGPEVVGKLVSEVLPDVERFFIDIHDRVARTGTPERFENYNQSTGRWYNAQITAVGGQGRLAASVFEDVSARKLAEIALRESEERQAFLLKLSDALRPLVDPLDIQHAAMKLLAEQFGVMRAGYLVAADDDENTMIMAAHFERDAPITPERIRLSDYGSDLVDAFRAGRTMVVRDTQADEQTEEQRAAHRAIGIGSWIIAPLRKAGRLIAIVGVVDRAPRDWTAVEVQLITEVAERTWAAVERARAEAALRDNEERQAFLLQLADVLRGLADPIEIEEQATRLLARQLRVSRAVYATFVVDGDREYVTIEREHRAPGTPSLVGRYPAEAWKDDIDTLRAGRATVIPDIEVEPMSDERRASWQALGARARMGVPLVKGGRLAVVLGVHSAIPRAWTAQDVELVREIGERTWAAVERARAEEALRDSEERQAFLLALSDALRPLTDSGEIERTATKLLGEHLQADRCFLSPVYEDGLGMCVREEYLRGDASSVLGDYTFGQFGDFVGPELQAGRILAVEDVSALAGLSAAERASYETVGIGAYLLIPLIRDDRLAAFLTINHQTPRPWSEADKAVAQQTADRLWTARERGRAETELRESQARLATELGGTERLRGLAEYFVAEDNADKLHDEILSAAIELTQADAGTIQLYDTDTHSLMLLVTRNIERRMTDHFHRVDANSSTACGKALRSGARTFVDFDDETDEACRMHIEAGYRSAQATPLLSRAGRPLGMLNTHWREAGHRPNERELRFLDLLARQAADLIEQRCTQAILRESEARFREFGENSSDALWIINAKTQQLEYLSPAFERIWGESRERVMADVSRWAELVHPDDRAQAAEAMPRLLAGAACIAEYRIVRPDGEVRWIRDAGFPIVEDGVVRRGGGIAQDVTSLKHAESAVRDSEQRLRQFGEASQDVLWIRDVDTLQWTYLTPAFETIYGLSREEALSGDNYRSWIELVVPEDRQLAGSAIQRVRDGEHVTFDYRIRRPVDGAVRWLRNTDFPITDVSGKVALVGGIGHDFTELREAELRLTTLMEGIPQLVWRAVDGGHWTWSSPQWTDYTGQTPEDSAGRGWLEALHPDDRDEAMHFWEQAVASGHLEMEARICHAASRQYRWFQSRATPVRDENGAIVEWLGTSTDIDDVRELQERQKVLVAELQHRTRNLMGVVRSMSDKTARTSADLSDFRGRFRDRLEALARVQGLLSRMNDHDRVTFNDLVQTELSAMNGSADRVTLSGPNGVRLRSSTVQTLAMALHELATNAVKYGALRQSSGHLSISWALEREGGKPWLHIDWRERGVDMPLPGSPPRGTGQGRELIEQALPYQLRARTSYTLGPDGVHCTISIPVSATTAEMEEHA